MALVTVFAFEKLEVYTLAREFRRRIYKLARLLPKDEPRLKLQMRDAARSLTNNIAEGHGRFAFPDRIHFLRMARGSLQELVDDVNLCIDETYAKPEHLQTLKDDANQLLRKLNAYMKYLRTKNATTPLKQPGPAKRKPN